MTRIFSDDYTTLDIFRLCYRSIPIFFDYANWVPYMYAQWINGTICGCGIGISLNPCNLNKDHDIPRVHRERHNTPSISVWPWPYPEVHNSRCLVSSQMEIQLQRLTIARRCNSNCTQNSCLLGNIGTEAWHINPSCINIQQHNQLRPIL